MEEGKILLNRLFMTYAQLNNEQKILVAGQYLQNINEQNGEGTSWSEYADPFSFVSEQEVADYYSDTEFTDGDFPTSYDDEPTDPDNFTQEQKEEHRAKILHLQSEKEGRPIPSDALPLYVVGYHMGHTPEQARHMLFDGCDDPEPENDPENDPDELPTVVAFRCFPDGEVIALFPELISSTGRGETEILSYMHYGQHGGASPELLTELREADPVEYEPLLAELTAIGYHLEPEHPTDPEPDNDPENDPSATTSALPDRLRDVKRGDTFMMEQRGRVPVFRAECDGDYREGIGAYIEYHTVRTGKGWYSYDYDAPVKILERAAA